MQSYVLKQHPPGNLAFSPTPQRKLPTPVGAQRCSPTPAASGTPRPFVSDSRLMPQAPNFLILA
ncbi:hypothetical protein CC79DRAFT_1333008 [Sarocladium strictum]